MGPQQHAEDDRAGKAVQHENVQGDAENPPGRPSREAHHSGHHPRASGRLGDHDDMRRMIDLYFATTEERGSPVARIRGLFDGVNVLIGDFNVSELEARRRDS